ncbi:hypothetical protein [Actinomadura litoris]|uniref:hypothetical protein n=1 Tax=Actinomadura litoris TaxID=2678616 RepID=UPI001FA75B6B|nr:hypothetical protein [Actinomadura litoris]
MALKRHASNAQRILIERLMDERVTDDLDFAPVLTEAFRRWPDDWHTYFKIGEASYFITCLRQAPIKPPRWAASAEEVPAGVYKLGRRTFKVERPETGDWAGWVFIRVIEPKPKTRLHGPAVNANLAKIAKARAVETATRQQ